MFYRLTGLLRACGCAAILAFGISGCGTFAPAPKVQPAQQAMRVGLKLSPASLGQSISVQQHFSVTRDDRVDELDAALEVDAKHIELVALALGQRVLRIYYDGKELQSWRHAMLPQQVRAEEVLEDMQLSLWPLAAIRQALPAGWRIEESGLRRTLLANDVTVMTIDYSGASRWNGTITLNNLRYQYRLVIQSVSTTQ